jgi:hypothetical protein
MLLRIHPLLFLSARRYVDRNSMEICGTPRLEPGLPTKPHCVPIYCHTSADGIQPFMHAELTCKCLLLLSKCVRMYFC